MRFSLRSPSGHAGRSAAIIVAGGIVAGGVAFALLSAGSATTEAGGPTSGTKLFSEVSSTTNSEPGPSTMLGDVNCDGDVDSIDAAFVLWSIAAIVDFKPCRKNANVNLDGAVNSVDAFLILQFHALLLPALPPPVSSSIGPIGPEGSVDSGPP